MTDKLGYSPLAKMEDSCYITPISETKNGYRCLISGFFSSDLMMKDDFDFEKFEETLPELYKVVKQIDDEGRVWYPQSINIPGKGIAFILGTNSEDWEWTGIKSVPVSEEEKEKFKNPKTGEYFEYKDDPTTLKRFGKVGFIDTLDYLEIL